MVCPRTLRETRAIELAQCTACLDRGHDAIFKNDAALVINVTVGSSPQCFETIDMVGFAPTRCLDLLCCHADPRLAPPLAFRFRFLQVDFCRFHCEGGSVYISGSAVGQPHVVIRIAEHAFLNSVRLQPCGHCNESTFALWVLAGFVHRNTGIRTQRFLPIPGSYFTFSRRNFSWS